MDYSEKQYNSIQQYYLRFLKPFDTDISLLGVIRNYQSTTDDFMNCSSIWTNILEELCNCKNTEEYSAKLQYLIYHCIICLTDCKNEKWQKYYNIVSKLELVPIYPNIGHFKLMITFFQKIEEKTETEYNYFENEKNRIYFAKNELFCDFNFYQLHYLQTIFELEKFTLSSYGEMIDIKEDNNNIDYQLLNNKVDRNSKIQLNKYKNYNCQEMNNYIINTIEILYHNDYQLERSDETTMSYQQLQNIIHIIGSPYIKLYEKYMKFRTNLNDKQLCFVGN